MKNLRRLACKFDLNQSERKSSQVNASARKSWPNGVASRPKFSTCGYLRLRLTKALNTTRAFGIFIHKLLKLRVPSFVISIGTERHVFVSHNVVGSSGLAIFVCLYALIKRVKLLTEKRTLKASFFSQKQPQASQLTIQGIDQILMIYVHVSSET